MAKRIAGLFLALALLAACVPAVAEVGGEDFRLHGYTEGTLVYDASFLDPREGPGYRYPAVAFSLNAGSTVRVMTQRRDQAGNTWVLAEGGGRRAYLLQKDASGSVLIRCDLKGIPTEPAQLISTWGCMCYEPQSLRLGPGRNYPVTGYVMDPDETAWVVLMNGDWALVECSNVYDDDAGDVPFFRRGWVEFGNLVY